jgi:uncharacterized protein YciI
MPWFVKIERGIVDKALFDRHVPAHKAYVRSLIEGGHRAKSGYWGDFGGGMLLFEAASLAEAEAIVRQDPLIQSGCVEYELHEWRIVIE